MRSLLWILVALLVLGTTAPAATAGDRRLLAPQGIGPTLAASPTAATGLAQLRQKALGAGKVRVIVGLRVPFAAEAGLSRAEVASQRRDITRTAGAVLGTLPGLAPGTARSFATLPFVALDASPADLDGLATNPAVLSVSEDHRNGLHLAESVPLIGGTAAWAAGYTGLGETIAILDTGVDKMHPFLAGKVVSEACYSTGGWCPGGRTSSTAPGSARPCPVSECAHGTHVAGIAAGKGDSFSGVAKDASIIAIQVMSPFGKLPAAYDSDIIAGLMRVVELKDSYRIAAVNMSLGSDDVYADTCDGIDMPMKAAIDEVRAAGIATVVSSGNSSSANGLSHPACLSNAVSVGAVSDSAWGPCAGAPSAADKVACYSNSARYLSLLAPGSLITSSVPGRKYASYHGTSMAAPHVAGAWAVLKEKAPDASVEQVQAALTVTGVPIFDLRNHVTTARINVRNALDRFSDSRVALDYAKDGPAQGSVSFSPAGTVGSCNSDCINRFTPGAQVTLTATPPSGVTFFGWGGDCSGTATCTVNMTARHHVSATFFTGAPRQLSYQQGGNGGGSTVISAAGFTMNCAADCTQTLWQNAIVTLTVQPEAGSAFTGWTGACRGKKTTCRIRLSSARSVRAGFDKLAAYPFTYTRQGLGSGSVSFGVDGLPACADSCTASLYAGTKLTLRATPDAGSVFVGWGGTCRGSKPACTFTLTSAASVSANFRTATAASAGD